MDKYIGNFLCGGCSKNPIELLKSAGVDMSTPKPVDDALKTPSFGVGDRCRFLSTDSSNRNSFNQ